MTDSMQTEDRATVDDGGGSGSRLPLIAGGLLVVVVIVVGALWWFLRDDAPEAVDLDTAAAEAAGDADGDADGDAGGTTDDGSAQAAGVDGTWTVDTSIGEFSFEDSTGTYVGFRVAEELSTIGATEAVGRTPEVSGAITISGQTVSDVIIEADLAALSTDVGRRDSQVHRALDTAQFPTAGFVLTEPIDLGTVPEEGQSVAATAVGDLTVHGQTNPVEVAIEAQLVGDTVVVVGSIDFALGDYGITAPSAPIVLSIAEDAIVEFQLFLTRA